MTSKVEICNMALAHIRAGSINSLTEPSIQAQQCVLFYPQALGEVLESIRWGFAHKTAALGVLTTDLFSWAYSYQYPSDCIRINYLLREEDEVSTTTGSSQTARRNTDPNAPRPGDFPPPEYEIQNVDGNRVIGANETLLRIDYNIYIENANLFPKKMVSALAYLLASYIAVPIAGAKEGRALSETNLGRYAVFIEQAEDSDNNQRQYDQTESDFVTVRN